MVSDFTYYIIISKANSVQRYLNYSFACMRICIAYLYNYVVECYHREHGKVHQPNQSGHLSPAHRSLAHHRRLLLALVHCVSVLKFRFKCICTYGCNSLDVTFSHSCKQVWGDCHENDTRSAQGVVHVADRVALHGLRCSILAALGRHLRLTSFAEPALNETTTTTDDDDQGLSFSAPFCWF